MNLFKLSALVVATSLATGCTSLFEQQTKKVEVKNRESGLVVPGQMNNPIKSEEYKLYKAAPQMHTEILAPNSVLAILDGSWVDQEDPHHIKIKVEKPALVTDFPDFIRQGVESYVDFNQLTSEKTATGYRITKVYKEESGFWFWKSYQGVEQLEFDLTIDLKPHGRSGSVFIDVVDYKVLNQQEVADVSPKLRAESLAIQALNDIMLEVDYLYRIKVKNEQESLDISLKLAKHIAGHYEISSQQDIKLVWSQIEDIIEELGFEVLEQDESLYVYDTQFVKSSGSAWNPFDSGISAKLDIEEGEYEVALSTSTTGVGISFRAKNGGYLSQAQMESLFEHFLAVAQEEEAEL